MGDSMGPQKTVVLDVVGLSRNLISPQHTPFLHRYLEQSDILSRDVEPAFPALTCPAQSTYLSGTGPTTHGITANVRRTSYHRTRSQREEEFEKGSPWGKERLHVDVAMHPPYTTGSCVLYVCAQARTVIFVKAQQAFTLSRIARMNQPLARYNSLGYKESSCPFLGASCFSFSCVPRYTCRCKHERYPFAGPTPSAQLQQHACSPLGQHLLYLAVK